MPGGLGPCTPSATLVGSASLFSSSICEPPEPTRPIGRHVPRRAPARVWSAQPPRSLRSRVAPKLTRPEGERGRAGATAEPTSFVANTREERALRARKPPDARPCPEAPDPARRAHPANPAPRGRATPLTGLRAPRRRHLSGQGFANAGAGQRTFVWLASEASCRGGSFHGR